MTKKPFTVDAWLFLCGACRDYVSNDDVTALDDVEADRVQRGAADLMQVYSLSFSNTAGENWFKCECCKTHSFSDRHIYAGKKRGDEVR